MHTSRLSIVPTLAATAFLSASALVACNGENTRAAAETAEGAAESASVSPAVDGVMAGAALHIRYQWQRNGVDIPGADQPFLTLQGTSLEGDRARFTLVVTQADGSMVRRPGLLAVVAAGAEPPGR